MPCECSRQAGPSMALDRHLPCERYSCRRTCFYHASAMLSGSKHASNAVMRMTVETLGTTFVREWLAILPEPVTESPSTSHPKQQDSHCQRRQRRRHHSKTFDGEFVSPSASCLPSDFAWFVLLLAVTEGRSTQEVGLRPAKTGVHRFGWCA